MIFTNKGRFCEVAREIDDFITPYAYEEMRKGREEGLNIRQCMAKASINMPQEVLAMIAEKSLDTLEVHSIWISAVECIGLDKILDEQGW